jgi:protein tyrosine/serine phosphatase
MYTRMMYTRIYWIDAPKAGRLAIMPRPRGGEWLEDEIAGWRDAGIDTIVGLLEQEEIAELELDQEAGLCGAKGMEFVSFPIPDRGVPVSLRDTSALVRLLSVRLAAGNAVAVHCRAGIGRSALIAACVLTCAGYDPIEAFTAIAASRRLPVPDTDGQRDWVVSFHAAAGGRA